jgi:hypothetical protein
MICAEFGTAQYDDLEIEYAQLNVRQAAVSAKTYHVSSSTLAISRRVRGLSSFEVSVLS